MLKVDSFYYSLSFKPSFSLLDKRDGIVLKIEDETGATGYGEVAPLSGFSKETLQSANASLEAFLQTDTPEALSVPPSVEFGVESAYLSLMANKNKCDINQVIFPYSKNRIPVHHQLIGSIEECEQQVKEYQNNGTTTFKLKVGAQSLQDDLYKIKRIVSTFKSDTRLRLDANRRWTFDDARAACKELNSLPIEFIEEPTDHPKYLMDLKEETDIPIAIDETFQENSSVPLLGLPYVDVIIIKPSFIGGTTRCLELAQDIMATEKKVVFTSAFESGLGCLITAHLAAAVSPDSVHGVATYPYFENDLLHQPPTLEGGYMQLHSNLTLNNEHLMPVPF
jgi:O-succinylbenzoate synthase